MANRPFEQQAKDYERLGLILRTDPDFPPPWASRAPAA